MKHWESSQKNIWRICSFSVRILKDSIVHEKTNMSTNITHAFYTFIAISKYKRK